MRIIDITHPPKDLWIGRESENKFRPIAFECANWFEAFSNATIVAYYQPYATSNPYPLVLTADGTKRIWHPTATELVKGNGELQIVLMLGDVVGTSAIIPTRVDRSLISSADHPASEAPSWTVQVVQDVTEQADRAEEAASHYPKIVNGIWYVWSVQAEDFVSTGIEAQGEDGVSTTVTVTEIEGGHRVTITDVDGAHTFDVMDGDDGSGAVESVNGQTGAVVLDAEDVGALPANTPIPAAVTEQTVAGWGFTKNTGTYSKPSGGIPASDLASAVQTSLGKADTALQTAPVTSVNNKTGAVTLTASDVGALPSSTSIPTAVSDLTNDSGYQTAPFEIEVTQSGSTYSTTASAADILAHQDNCVAVLYGTKVSLSAVTGNEYMAELFFSNLTVNEGAGYTMAQQIHISVDNGVVTVLADMMVLEDIPSVTSADDGKFLRVVNGAWAAETVSTWQGGSY